MSKPVIVWFRQDLRLRDHPAFYEACLQDRPVLPVYILDDEAAGEWKMGGASRVWLYHALKNLQEEFEGHLVICKGNARQELQKLIEESGSEAVYWNRCYEPWQIERDKDIKKILEQKGIEANSFNGSLLWEPWTIKNQSGEPYKVFTPYYRKGCLAAGEPDEPLPAPDSPIYAQIPSCSLSIEDLDLLPHKEGDWAKRIISKWDISEAGAQERLNEFLKHGLSGYKEGRNNPAQNHVSRLSSYLHFGHVSPRQVWNAAKLYASAHQRNDNDIDCFCSEIGWREFSHSLLYHFPKLPRENLQKKFDQFPWRQASEDELDRWRYGRTGYPIVDAAMRELWQTGYMHNRCRMIVGSFLVKHMMVHWHIGEDWFWDCLFDADLANNSASWQWIAGCGADAAPYFRIFNPITQGEKFDPEGDYTRHYVPELAKLPTKYLFAPWEAPDNVLHLAGVVLGETYPKPLVDHKDARERALHAFETIKAG